MKKYQGGGKTGAQLKKEGMAMKAKGQAMKAEGAAMKAKGSKMATDYTNKLADRMSTGSSGVRIGSGYGTQGVSMKTGGMVNSNAKVSALKSAGSHGVKSGVNPKAAASKVARGRVGGTSSAPKTAVPKAKYGMVMRKK